MDFSALWQIYGLDHSSLKFDNFIPRVPHEIKQADGDIFTAARTYGEILMVCFINIFVLFLFFLFFFLVSSL